MRWSWKVGTVLGIELRMHATFVVLLVWSAISGYSAGRSVQAAAIGVAFTLAVFATVVLHELGHALAARRFGIGTKDITLLPIGGVARLEQIPDNPRQELLVALAGPVVNVVLAALLFLALELASAPVFFVTDLDATSPFWTRLFWVNVMLATFNLLPAFPMDGGRVARALLAMRMDYVRATHIAAKLGQGLAFAIAVIGTLFNPMLLLIALFVWIGAAAESASVEAKAMLTGIPVRAAMITRFAALEPGDTLDAAAAQLLSGSDVNFPVVAGGRLVGVLPRAELVRGLAELGGGAPVLAAMKTRFAVAAPNDLLEDALARAEEADCRAVPVVDRGALVGMVTPENVAELFMLRHALARPAGRRRLVHRARSSYQDAMTVPGPMY